MKAWLSLILSLLALVLFAALCWTASADAQGAIALFFYAPVLAALTISACFLGSRASKDRGSLGVWAKRISIFLAAFFVIFYVSPFVGLNAISDTVIKWASYLK